LAIALAAGCLGSTPIVKLVEEQVSRRLGELSSRTGAAILESGYGLVQTVLTMGVLSASVAHMLASTYNPFIYFRF
jgi:hypothetical protein